MTPSQSAGALDPFAHVPPSLANASAGDEVLVEEILFDLVQRLCADQDIQVGDRLRVEDMKGPAVTVRNVRGCSVRIRVPYAFFIQVRPIPPRFTESFSTALSPPPG